MIVLILYFIFIFSELIFAAGFCAITISFIYSSIKGSPYVPTNKKEIEIILQKANLKPKKNFIELGCGDGRVCRYASHYFKVNSIGIDVNPFLVWYAKLLAWVSKVKNTKFYRLNIFDYDLTNADIVYLFLMPKLIQNLLPKFEKELKKNTLVISHGFKIEGWKGRLIAKINRNPFPTYYYRKG